MQVSCEIIKDLLPLYHDKVCSDDSKIMIEKHLLECDNCKAELQAMDKVLPISNAEQNLKDADVVRNLSNIWKKGMLISLIKGVLITLLTIIILALVLYLLLDIKIE